MLINAHSSWNALVVNKLRYAFYVSVVNKKVLDLIRENHIGLVVGMHSSTFKKAFELVKILSKISYAFVCRIFLFKFFFFLFKPFVIHKNIFPNYLPKSLNSIIVLLIEVPLELFVIIFFKILNEVTQ